MWAFLAVVGAALTNGYKLYAFVLTIISGTTFTRRVLRNWPYRHIKRLYGIKNGDRVVLLCSELPEAETLQWVEPREFIHLMKYGDVDALLELVASMLRIYPDIDLKILTAKDIEHVHVDLQKHIILVGGPDYNPLARRLIDEGRTAIAYYSDDIGAPSPMASPEITILEKTCAKEHFRIKKDEDAGYFERFVNPYSARHNVLIFGGCHTIGVTAAAKVFSAYSGGRNELSAQVQSNARLVAKITRNASAFYIVFEAKKVGVNVATPEIRRDEVRIVSAKVGRQRRLWGRVSADSSATTAGSLSA